jgi:hypothetical protein
MFSTFNTEKLRYFFMGFVLALACIWACTPGTETKDLQAKEGNKGSKIPSKVANQRIGAWDVERNFIDSTLKSMKDTSLMAYVVQGFQIPTGEFQEMLKDLGPNPQVWAMLAIAVDSTSKQTYLDLIFKAKSKKTGENPADGGYEYYDFTDPCPPFCPPNN